MTRCEVTFGDGSLTDFGGNAQAISIDGPGISVGEFVFEIKTKWRRFAFIAMGAGLVVLLLGVLGLVRGFGKRPEF